MGTVPKNVKVTPKISSLNAHKKWNRSEENKFEIKFFFTFLGLNWKGFRLTQSVNSGQPFYADRKNFFLIISKKNFLNC